MCQEMENSMNDSNIQKGIIFYLRMAMAWTFLYAGLSQVFGHFSAAGFLNATKTFHGFYMLFASPDMLPYTDFLVRWGHTLIGVSLLFGMLVRVSSVFGILLMITYYFAHMVFPYVDGGTENFIMDYHLVYAGVLAYLIAVQAGHVFGLDGMLHDFPIVSRHRELRAVVG
jgi:thiosulfate dehydrogenase (quinone) large subunit